MKFYNALATLALLLAAQTSFGATQASVSYSCLGEDLVTKTSFEMTLLYEDYANEINEYTAKRLLVTTDDPEKPLEFDALEKTTASCQKKFTNKLGLTAVSNGSGVWRLTYVRRCGKTLERNIKGYCKRD